MADKVPAPFSLKRWSRRKLEAAGRNGEPTVQPTAVPANLSDQPSFTGAANAPSAAATETSPELPAIESLTLESDFSAFMQPKVGESLKRQALKKLFSDPHFNVMDRLDTYIDDYSIPDPIAPEVVRNMVQSRYIFDPPATRINAEGYVEDVPAEETAVAATPIEDSTVKPADVNTGIEESGAEAGAMNTGIETAGAPPEHIAAQPDQAGTAIETGQGSTATQTEQGGTEGQPSDAGRLSST